jgi:hypothetical protein
MRSSRFLALSLGVALLLAGCGKNGADRKLNTDVNFATRSASGSAVAGSSSSGFADFLRPGTQSGSVSSGAMFFSLSSSSLPPFAMGMSSSSASAMGMPMGSGGVLPGMNMVAPGAYVKVHVDADKGTARPSDTVYYTVTVKNQSPIRIGAFQAILSFSPSQLSIVESDGQNQLDSVQWNVDGLDPGMKRALRVRAQVVSNVQPGDAIQVSAIATVNNFVQESTGSAQVTVTSGQAPVVQNPSPAMEPGTPDTVVMPAPLPHTGPGDFTGPLEDTRAFLFPSSGEGGVAIPAMFWLSVAAVGLGFGARMGKKIL